MELVVEVNHNVIKVDFSSEFKNFHVVKTDKRIRYKLHLSIYTTAHIKFLWIQFWNIRISTLHVAIPFCSTGLLFLMTVFNEGLIRILVK